MHQDFQPQHLGEIILFKGFCGEGMITDETWTTVFVEHPAWTGWMHKAMFFELLGSEGLEEMAEFIAGFFLGIPLSEFEDASEGKTISP